MMHTLIRLFSTDPVNLSIKGKLLAVAWCCCVILIMACISQTITPTLSAPILVASMGASAIILFIIPNSPLAQPWPFVGGQMISAMVGVSCALSISNTIVSATVAVSLSVLLMLLLRCLHPPAAATALTPVVGGKTIMALGYSFIWLPVGINVLVMLILAVVINRWIMGYDYPTLTNPATKKQKPAQPLKSPTLEIGISEQDLLSALEKTDVFVDVTPSELSKILTAAELYSFKRLHGVISCADIMRKDIVSVEYGTEVEEAWKLMLKHNLKAVPVVDRAQRVIGMVTWHDFFKFIDLSVYESLSQRLKAFIRRTPDISTTKPEAIGHLMSTAVSVLSEDSHIVELIPLMADNGHRQVPIVDKERRLVGMVYQTQLCAALYNQQLANKNQTVPPN